MTTFSIEELTKAIREEVARFRALTAEEINALAGTQ